MQVKVQYVRPVRTYPRRHLEDTSDDHLMVLAGDGDRRAFADLVGRYEQRIIRFCELLLRDAHTARDVTQEVFLRLWDVRTKYRAQGRLRQLLFSIARNECHSVSRRKMLQGLLFIQDESTCDTEVADMMSANMALTERDRILVTTLGKLPEKFRIPLALRFCEDMSYEDIARVIGRTTSAARSRVHYGLKHLAGLLPEDVSL